MHSEWYKDEMRYKITGNCSLSVWAAAAAAVKNKKVQTAVWENVRLLNFLQCETT